MLAGASFGLVLTVLEMHKCNPSCNVKRFSGHVLIFKLLTLTLPGPSAGVSGSLDSYCSLKPLCSGMGEVVPARTSPTLLPPSPHLCCDYPV